MLLRDFPWKRMPVHVSSTHWGTLLKVLCASWDQVWWTFTSIPCNKQ